jgi:hypothetical protein
MLRSTRILANKVHEEQFLGVLNLLDQVLDEDDLFRQGWRHGWPEE